MVHLPGKRRDHKSNPEGGQERGPKRQAVCLNAGAALYIAGKAASIEEGVKLAESSLTAVQH